MNTEQLDRLCKKCLMVPSLVGVGVTYDDYVVLINEAVESFGLPFVADQIENIARASYNTRELLEGTAADFEDYFLVPNKHKDKFEATLISMPCVKAFATYKDGKPGDENWNIYSVDVDTLILDDQYDLSEDDWDTCLRDERKKMFAYEFVCASERL